jgi:four helix bundle protein
LDSDGEIAETQTWLRFARDCGSLSPARQQELIEGYSKVGRMLGAMMAHPEKFS